MNQSTSRFIIKEDAQGIHELNVSSILAAEGKLFLTDTIDTESVTQTIRNMMYLSSINVPIKLYIDSTGGEVRAGLALVDAIEMLSETNTIEIICIGKAYSMAAVILAAGKKGHRFMLPHAEVMIHEPLISQGASGSASSVKSIADSLMSTRDLLSTLLSRHTGKSVKEVTKALSFDNFMNAQEAIEFGLVDSVAREL